MSAGEATTDTRRLEPSVSVMAMGSMIGAAGAMHHGELVDTLAALTGHDRWHFRTWNVAELRHAARFVVAARVLGVTPPAVGHMVVK